MANEDVGTDGGKGIGIGGEPELRLQQVLGDRGDHQGGDTSRFELNLNLNTGCGMAAQTRLHSNSVNHINQLILSTVRQTLQRIEEVVLMNILIE